MITQTYKKISKNIIKNLKNCEIRSLLERQRLRFSKSEINLYIEILFEHSLYQKSFKYLHKSNEVPVKYSCFMNNIKLFSKLFNYFFHKFNQLLNIKPSKLFNIVDTTLIPEKYTEYITQNDWNTSRVTTRIKNKIKIHICGSKGLVFINKSGKIYYAKRMNINYSDQNILKDTALYQHCLEGILLADRGFSNKTVRHRIKSHCRLISPYRKVEKKALTDKESRLYKQRWKIETLFQELKHHYADIKLNLSGKYSNTIKNAKFFSTLILFNLIK
jgi:hypothetical protein